MSASWLALEPVWRMGSIVFVLLIVAGIVTAAVGRAKPGVDLSEIVARVRSWWVMASVFFVALLVHPGASIVFFALLSFWSLKEYLTLLRTRPADHAALVLAFLAIPVQYYWVWIVWYGMFIVFIPVYVFLLLPLRLVLVGDAKGFVRSASEIQWGLMVFVFGISHLAYLLHPGPVAGFADVGGRTLLLFLVFVVELNDVLQFCWGKMLGRRKVIPSISPNKTATSPEDLVANLPPGMVMGGAPRFAI